MPKRTGNLYHHLCSIDALHKAYLTARRGKRTTASVSRFEENLGVELSRLEGELTDGSYTPKPYRTFWVYEPKKRLISAPAFRDVVVQHAIYKTIYPLFDKTFIYDSYGCRVGKGTHRAADQSQRFLRQCSPESYILQLDIRKFYYSINRTVLMELMERTIKDQRLLQLLEMFTRDAGDKGVPIGNLLSQLFALIYLNPLDHFIKRTIKAKRYVRYVDDFIVFGLDKEEAIELRDTLIAWLRDTLDLELSRWSIHQVKRGVNFVGFRTWQLTRMVRRHSLHNFGRALRAGKITSLVSILGNAKRSATYRHMARRLVDEAGQLLSQLPLGVKNDLLQLHEN
jgi:RNA-directed DNA polymerase